MNFTGADKVIVYRTDPTMSERPVTTKEIIESETIRKIQGLPAGLPRTGSKMVSWPPVVVHTAVACRGNRPFAHFSFYGDGSLQAENFAFFLGENGEGDNERALWQIIKID